MSYGINISVFYKHYRVYVPVYQHVFCMCTYMPYCIGFVLDIRILYIISICIWMYSIHCIPTKAFLDLDEWVNLECDLI